MNQKPTLDWNEYLAKAAEAVAEGIVMVRNENRALPLRKDEEVAVFGRIQLHYYKSGTGSGGMVNVAKVTSILDGLLEAGVPVNEKLLSVYKAWDEAHPFDLGHGWGAEPWAQEEMPLDEALVQETASSCKTAIVIIGRTAGEEQDNHAGGGSYLLTAGERDMLRLTRAHFERVIVLLNVGNIMDMGFVDDYSPDAVLYVWQGGMTGGTGTAQVLTGKVSPSGKLPDTIAYSVKDYPSDAYFGDRDCNRYAEDIYVGYRYFETFAKEKVRYPFGFGLSYTTFSITPGDYEIDRSDAKVYLNVEVENTGDRPGKEVVQLYCEPTQGVLGNPARVLISFAKTKTLAPGEKQTLRLALEVPWSYDDSGATGHRFCYVQEEGGYRFFAGSDVRHAVPAMILVVDDMACEKCQQAMAPVQAFQRMKPVKDGDSYQIGWEDVPLLAFDEKQRRLDALPEELRSDGKRYVLRDVKDGSCTLGQFVAQLPDAALCSLARGEGMGSPRVTAGTASAFGGVTDELVSYGIPAACCSDGPSGMRLDCGTKAFSLPNGTLLAATFNQELLEELFYLMGLEMTSNHVDCLLGPGMNIHRHPLNGRNFEYFSEDPLLTGKMAAAELRGLHKAGVTGTVKHCCGNNQETNRHFLDAVVSERALREIYLRGFEIAVKEGGADSIMTTYGSVNGLWTAGNYDLCTQIIRKEWGFSGFLMTDWWANINERGGKPDKKLLSAMVRAQNDVYMVCAECTEANGDDLMQALSDGRVTRGELQRTAMNVCNFLLGTKAMERLCGIDTAAVITNRPDDENDANAEVIFYDVVRDFTLDLTGVKSERGRSYVFGLNVLTPGWFEVTVTASSTAGELAQMAVTLYAMGTASGTFTWNGTNGEPVSFTNRVPMFSKYSAMRLYFAQNGLDMVSIRFKQVSEMTDLTSLIEGA
ncbi:MAG: glycoside hydrolase family 3 C-terminal domain-containing protein [Oscillospiraceae bacterium]|nr:glycoside hydrolase family 3 C-terminal domain-containing protein [Oscillospiraceae bacterium]